MLIQPYSQKRLDEAKAAVAALPYDDAAIFLLDILENATGLSDGLAETLANVDCDDLIDAIAEHIGIPRTPRTLKDRAAIGGVA